jgi:restriction system protein
MAIWLIRAGGHGEYEQKFLSENRVYVTWNDFNRDLNTLPTREAVASALHQVNPDSIPKRLSTWANQIWPFAHEIRKGDIVILPSKVQPVIYIGEISGDYKFESQGPNPFFHWRSVKWNPEPVPRTHFSQDLLYSFGAFLTICRIRRNDAEARILKMKESGWKPEVLDLEAPAPQSGSTPVMSTASDEVADSTNLEDLGQDQIARYITEHFKEHEFTRLVAAILKAQGYTIFQSPAGPDGGADILAGHGPMGFSSPKLCVEVKSGSAPIGREAVDKLLGAVTKFGADQGLFVAWSGYRQNVLREMAPSFFRVRLWTRTDLLQNLFDNYDKLDEDIRAELPLKRIWTIAKQDEE